MSSITRREALTVLAGAAALSMPYINTARAEENVVNIYSWADYFGDTTMADFEAATGVRAVYDTFSSAEEMQAKMLAGSTGYDVVDMAGISLPQFVKANIYEKLDRAKLPGWNNLDPAVLKMLQIWDPGNAYGIPYMWGSAGFTFNVDMVKERLPNADLQSLDTIFKPENAAKLADCGISILDSPTDIMPMVAAWMGLDGKASDPKDFQAIADAFKPIRKYIRSFDNANYLNAIPNKELCVVNDWSGDYSTARQRAKDAGVEINLAYYIPKTGAGAWIDLLCIPADAKHKDNAYKFLEYMLQPEVIAKCTNFTNYANGNLASKKFVDPEILANPAVYPDEESMKRLWTSPPYTEEQDREFTRIWQTIKSG